MRFLAVGLLLSCAATLVQAQESYKLEYTPTEAVLANPQPSFNITNAIKVGEVFVERADPAGDKRAKVTRFFWRNSGLRLAYEEKDAGAPASVLYDSIFKAGAVRDTTFMASRWGVPLAGGWVLWCEARDPERCAKALADRLLYYKSRQERTREADRLFAEALAKYRDPASRPELPEEVRKYKIQAEFAIDNKRLGDAINLYTQAVVTARWWADGYFNLALLYAEQKNYAEAVRLMKRFLALQEGTPDARRALDMTYRWETMIPADEREP